MCQIVFCKTDHILDIPLSMVLKCQVSYIACRAARANVGIAPHKFPKPQVMGLMGLLDPLVFLASSILKIG